MELANIKKAQFSPTSLSFDSSITLDEWTEIGRQLKLVESGIQWWLADWLNFGEHHYGEVSSQVLNATDYNSAGSLHNLKYVASRFESSRRHEGLSFTAHAEVASLDTEQQDELLDRAEKQDMTTREIRLAVRAIKTPYFAQAPMLEVKIETTRDMLSCLSDWVKHGIDVSWDYLGYDVLQSLPGGIVKANLLFKPKGINDDGRAVEGTLPTSQ